MADIKETLQERVDKLRREKSSLQRQGALRIAEVHIYSDFGEGWETWCNTIYNDEIVMSPDWSPQQLTDWIDSEVLGLEEGIGEADWEGWEEWTLVDSSKSNETQTILHRNNQNHLSLTMIIWGDQV